MRLNIVEIRQDEQGDLWFLVEKYYTPADDSEVSEDWWLHLSDEYALTSRVEGPLNGKRYRLVEETE